jgi:hypothetical protein
VYLCLVRSWVVAATGTDGVEDGGTGKVTELGPTPHILAIVPTGIGGVDVLLDAQGTIHFFGGVAAVDDNAFLRF